MKRRTMLGLGLVAVAGLAIVIPVSIAADTGQGRETADQMFLKDAYQSNLFEIQLSKHVAANVDRPQIKEFAQKMVDDHTRANEKIEQAAQSKGVQLDKQLKQWQQAKLDEVKKLDSQTLGRKYMFHQVGNHQACLLENHYQAKHAQDQAVKSLASNMIPTLEQHAGQARQIAGTLAGVELTGTPISRERSEKSHEGHHHKQDDKSKQQQSDQYQQK